MAGGYTCDNDPDHGPAAQLTTNLETGATLALCGDCWVLFVEATHDAVAQAIRAQADAAQADAESGPDDPDEDDEDAEAVARLGQHERRTIADEVADEFLAQGAQDAPGAHEVIEGVPTGTRVVKRGTSPSRRRHAAKTNAKARAQEVAADGNA